MILVILAILVLLAIDVGVTAFALTMVGSDQTSFWTSFWSGLAYSFWTGSLLFLIAGLVLWRLQEHLQIRWRMSREHETMKRDAIVLANNLYAEFPVKPVVFTNSEVAAARFEAEHRQAQENVFTPLLADKAVDCVPHAVRRVHRRMTSASPMVWSEASPAAELWYFFSEFVRVHEATMSAARTLDYRLVYHARRLNRSSADDIRNEADRCFYLGKLLGYSQETLVSILAAQDAEEQRALPERHARLKTVDALDGPSSNFASGLAELRRLLESLRDAPRTVPMAYKGLILSDSPLRRS